MLPRNGSYMTSMDFEMWQEYFSRVSGHKSTTLERECNTCSECSLTSLLRTKNITFVVSESCNLNCTYCYQKCKTQNVMTEEVAYKAIDMLFDENKVNGYYDAKKAESIILEFIGGEPLLAIDLMDKIVEYFKFKAFELDHPWVTNYMISVSSNGVLFFEDKVQDFLKRNRNRVSFNITIDGNKELHDSCRVFHDGRGSYDIVEKAAKKWLESEPYGTTKITLCPENVMHLNSAIKNVWENIGYRGVYCNCVFEEGWKIEDAKILYSEMKKLADYMLDNELYKKYFISLFDETIGQPLKDDTNWCGGNGSMLAIGHDGRCYPCIRFMKYCLSNPDREEKCIGNINDGLQNEEQSPWLKELKSITMTTQSPDKCLTCPIATGCSLCTAYHYDKFGDPNKRATFICETHKARVIANYYYWNKLFKKLNLDNKFELNIPKDWALQIIDEEEYNMLLNLLK